MLIYPVEIKDGLELQLRSNSSIAYTSKINTNFRSYINNQSKYKEFLKAQAARDNLDLYPVDSLLVSIGINKNDDVFDKAEVWMARHTPEDKAFNFEHFPTDIIGHIVSNAAVDTDLQPIPDDIDPTNLPDKFHIITASVIYKYLDDKNYLERIEKLIPEIEAGEWCVSMECLFQGFDYAMTNSKGEHSIIPRDETTAYLTKHLRSYGGTGKFQDYTVGRLLRNITFSGHGLVRNPANPESVIFNNVKNFSGTVANSVYFNSNCLHEDMEKSIMPDFDIKSLDAYAELKSKYDRLEAELAKYTSDAAKAEVEKLRTDYTATAAKVDGLEKQLGEATKTIADLRLELTVAKDGAAEYEKKAKEEYGKRTKAERTMVLVKAGAPEGEIDGFIENFGALADEQFNAVVALAAKSWSGSGGQINTVFEGDGKIDVTSPNKIMEDTSKAKEDKKKKSDDMDDTEATVLDTVVPTDTTTAAVSNETVESARAELLTEIDAFIAAKRPKNRGTK